jgi:hypothetical protein
MNHLNKLTILPLAFFLSACDTSSTNQKNDTTTEANVIAVDTVDITDLDSVAAEAKATVDSIANEVNNAADHEHKHYTSVMEMVEDRNDFTTEDGTLKLISKSPLHIQISTQEDKNQDVNRMKRVSSQFLVSTAYAAFACTDISKITITSVPCDVDEYIQHHKIALLHAAAVTVTITREKARQVMQSHVGTSNFDDMLGIPVGNSYSADSPSPLLLKLKAEETIDKLIQELKS